MTELQFAQRAFLKCGFEITSITDDSTNSLLFKNCFEDALRTVIYDTRGKEFLASLKPSLIYRKENRIYNDYYIYEKPRSIVVFMDRVNLNELSNPFGYGDVTQTIESSYYISQIGQPYHQIVDPNGKDVYLASKEKELTIYGAFFNKNLNLWSVKSLESAITYLAYLLAPTVSSDRRNLTTDLLKEYLIQTGQYKTMDTSTKRYATPPSSYDFPLGSEYGLRNLYIPGGGNL